jgi:ribonuclease R/exosome complex exonuclease DIS3/RRP44
MVLKPNGSVIKVLGYAGEHETEIHSREEYGLPYNFDIDFRS